MATLVLGSCKNSADFGFCTLANRRVHLKAIVYSQPTEPNKVYNLLYCAPESPLNVWYLDDGTIGGPVEKVLNDYPVLVRLGAAVGLELNTNKCEVYLFGPDALDTAAAAERFAATIPGVKFLTKASFVLLGAPVFAEAVPPAMDEKTEYLQRAVKRMRGLPPHPALFILRACFGSAKVVYILRAGRVWMYPDKLASFDAVVRDGVAALVNVEMTSSVWRQASLPVGFGGLGIRQTAELAHSAFLASVHAVQDLVLTIFPDSNLVNELVRPTEAWSVVAGGAALPAEDVRCRQKQWDLPVVQHAFDSLLAAAADVEKARLLSVSTPESSCWLNAWPCSNVGTLLDADSLRIGLALRLGAPICHPHKCRCGEEVDEFGRHASCCGVSRGRLSRHAELNGIVCGALVAAKVFGHLEPNLSRTDHKRPDGITGFHWTKGRYLLWDVTCVDTLAPSHVARSLQGAGVTADDAEQRKRVKYSELMRDHEFAAVGVETYGAWGSSAKEFIGELGRRIARSSGEPRSLQYLRQRISFAVLRGNVVSVLGTRLSVHGLDEVYYILEIKGSGKS